MALARLSKAEIAKLQGGGKTTRHLEFASLEDVDEAAIVRLLRLSRR